MNLEHSLGSEWHKLLSPLFSAEQFTKLGRFLETEQHLMTPKLEDVFNAYKYCQPSAIKAVIIGQDPYPAEGVAHGLSFSCKKGTTPMSLRIIFQELERCGLGTRTNADLTDWAEQGVLLLNSVLTTRVGEPFAHANKGWEWFTGQTLNYINTLQQRYVVMAWGKPAQALVDTHIVPTADHVILRACHPMAQQYSGGKLKFVGCGHFIASPITNSIKWV